MVQWTDHIPQAMQQHGASRKSGTAAIQNTAPADRNSQSGWPNVAEDAASLLTTSLPATPAARSSSP